MIRTIELFAGIGAQRQALKEAGIEHEIVAISEVDKYACMAYEALHGRTENVGDIRKVDRLPEADLWTYSFPCADISLSGRMRGFTRGSGTQSSLLWEVQRLLQRAKDDGTLPRFLLMENVKNIVSKRKTRRSLSFSMVVDMQRSMVRRFFWKRETGFELRTRPDGSSLRRRRKG